MLRKWSRELQEGSTDSLQKEFEKLGIQTEEAERELAEDIEVGKIARSVNDPKGDFGKAVRINEGPDAGKYLLIRAGKPDEVVRGGDIVFKEDEIGTASGRPLAQDTLQGLVKANGGTPEQ